ncbi:MAG: AAA family ATPase [bacterium]|nr:AAA family ATPase [bacterium]
MRLTQLSLSGFKSFAKTTVLEFPAAASAIVGPNGSGKSNVAEAIRWVLGEQSMKSLRGKRGEDLIFSGTPSVARMGKASVGLTFDNRDHLIPLDFESVALERKIFRDGTNEYYLQGSPVRLKDIVELLARIGLGEAKHNIIGQGEVDRILLSSPRERRDLFEEAIGLRLFQLRKREAERKLEETGENTDQVAALLREISPHLKFLKSQAEKAEKREVVRRELEEYYRAYVQAEARAITQAIQSLRRESGPAATKLERLNGEIARLRKDIESGDGGGNANNLRVKEQELGKLESRRRELERELGRIEGRIDAAHPRIRGRERVSVTEVEAALRPIIDELSALTAVEGMEALYAKIRSLAERFRLAVSELKRAAGGGSPEGENLAAERERIQGELELIASALERARQELGKAVQGIQNAEARIRGQFEKLREREDEANTLRAALQRLGFEEEKLSLRQRDLDRMIEESGFGRGELLRGDSPFTELGAEEVKRKIERLRARLEEIGGIDDAVLKEYQDTRVRHDFLERELADLAAAARDLRGLISELEDRIERDFQTGFAKIKDEFHHYFRIIFGGGKGVLAYVPLKKSLPAGEDEDATDTNAETDYGIDIEVDLPRKRIKGLAMLSGGEKALVSIALLFAITAVNPPPFLVLDETDAALDEANSKKYGVILKELSRKTQLILITHNRETMQQAGILYGVTMGDDGISKILSLKLEEAENYGNR